MTTVVSLKKIMSKQTTHFQKESAMLVKKHAIKVHPLRFIHQVSLNLIQIISYFVSIQSGFLEGLPDEKTTRFCKRL